MTDEVIIDGQPATDTAVTAAKSRRSPVLFSYEIAEAILVAIAEGKTLKTVSETPGMPSRNTVYKWLTQYPKFFDAYERAKEVSAQSLEDEALTIARNLAGTNDYTGVKVTALNYAMQQLRWSAARRDPARYGQKAETSTTVPIQINTTLNLGQDGQPAATDSQHSVYTIEAVVEARPQMPDAPDTDDPPTIDGELAPEDDGAILDDNGYTVFGADPNETGGLKEPKPRGRPPGRKQGPRKDARYTKTTATRLANKLKKGDN